MNIELITLDENEDGSAECELRMDGRGKEYLLELGFNTLLRMSIDAEAETPLSFDKEAQIHEKAYLEGWNDGFELGKKTIRDEA